MHSYLLKCLKWKRNQIEDAKWKSVIVRPLSRAAWELEFKHADRQHVAMSTRPGEALFIRVTAHAHARVARALHGTLRPYQFDKSPKKSLFVIQCHLD